MAEYSASIFIVMTGLCRFNVVEHLSNAALNEAIKESQQADEVRLIRGLFFVKPPARQRPRRRRHGGPRRGD